MHTQRPLLLLVGLFVSSAEATNLGFIRGDAFFHALLTEKALDSWEGDGFVIEYADTSPGAAAGCGYAGDFSLRVAGEATSTKAKLRDLYRALRTAYPKKLVVHDDGNTAEINGFHLFVYNRDFDFTQREFRLGVKYNEDWLARTHEEYSKWSGIPAGEESLSSLSGEVVSRETAAARSALYTTYESFIDSSAAVLHDWRMGPFVPPLKLVDSAKEGTNEGPRVEIADVQFVVVPRKNLKPYFNRRPGRGFYSITTDGVVVYRVTKKGVEKNRLESFDSVLEIEWDDE